MYGIKSNLGGSVETCKHASGKKQSCKKLIDRLPYLGMVESKLLPWTRKTRNTLRPFSSQISYKFSFISRQSTLFKSTTLKIMKLFNLAFIAISGAQQTTAAAFTPPEQSSSCLDPLSRQQQTVLTAYNLFFSPTHDQSHPDVNVFQANRETATALKTKAKCTQPDMKKCMLAVGGVGAATCALSGIETLGFTCIGALVGGGIGSASCFYKNCHFVE